MKWIREIKDDFIASQICFEDLIPVIFNSLYTTHYSFYYLLCLFYRMFPATTVGCYKMGNKGRQYTYNVLLRRVQTTILPTEKQRVLHILRVYL